MVTVCSFGIGDGEQKMLRAGPKGAEQVSWRAKDASTQVHHSAHASKRQGYRSQHRRRANSPWRKETIHRPFNLQ